MLINMGKKEFARYWNSKFFYDNSDIGNELFNRACEIEGYDVLEMLDYMLECLGEDLED